MLFQSLQLLLQRMDASADMPAVAFQLALARAAGSDAAAQSRQAGAESAQARQPVFELCQLHLQASGAGFGALGKDVQNQGGAVDDRNIHHLFNVLLLGRRQLVIEDDQFRLAAAHKIRQLLQAPSTHQGSWVGAVLALDHPAQHLGPCRFCQLLQLIDRALYIVFSGVHRRQHRGLLLLFVFVHRQFSLFYRFVHRFCQLG